jgi:hypothetical protein
MVIPKHNIPAFYALRQEDDLFIASIWSIHIE